MGLKSAAEERLRKEFSAAGTERAGGLYLPVSVACKYIEACELQALAIAGVDAHRLDGLELVADLGQIADFSSMFYDKEWEELVRATATEARGFVEQVPQDPNLRLMFTLLSREERESL